MKSILFSLLLVLSLNNTVLAQLPSSATGTWKRTGMTSVDNDGTISDDHAAILKAMPCSKNIMYTFNADGSILTGVPDECGAMKKTIESMNGDGKCSMSGNKLTVTSSKLPPAVYDVQFKGNTMIWYFDYTKNPKTLNPGGKTKSLTLVYTKI
ncbi:lipocalin family protein [Runella sp.]|uniref:lipocalin family protein n=1 Tax=Runella sp. TaxID=1960881 RepID=UPI003D12056C